MVKDMAAQLGIRAHPDLYWYCLFALRYSLAPEWEVILKQDTRFYVHLPSDRMQIVHPMIRWGQGHRSVGFTSASRSCVTCCLATWGTGAS